MELAGKMIEPVMPYLGLPNMPIYAFIFIAAALFYLRVRVEEANDGMAADS